MARMKTPLLILMWLFLTRLAIAQNDVGKQAETAYQNKQFDKAAILFLQVQDYYDAACSFALGGKKKEALTTLTKAVDDGYTNLSHINEDSDFASLRGTTEWKTTLTKIEKIIRETASSVKKITVLENNNYLLNNKVDYLNYPDDISKKEYADLKALIEKDVNVAGMTDQQLIIELLNWVSSQWDHDGINEAPDSLNSYQIVLSARDGNRYRCVEYGGVLSDALKSFGFVSRSLGLTTPDVAYGGFGMGHVATEVWCNSLQKWIFVDPQFSVYVQHKGQYLNYYDIYIRYKEGKYDEISFLPTEKYARKRKLDLAAYQQEYKAFQKQYFGFINASYRFQNQKQSLALMLDGTAPYLTFQGQTSVDMVFTKNPDDFYFDMNRVSISFSFQQTSRFLEISKRYNIRTDGQYKRHMAEFAPVPNLNLSLLHNMPWFDHYEVRLNGKLLEADAKGRYPANLTEGVNSLEAVAINKSGLKGIPTKMVLRYGTDQLTEK